MSQVIYRNIPFGLRMRLYFGDFILQALSLMTAIIFMLTAVMWPWILWENENTIPDPVKVSAVITGKGKINASRIDDSTHFIDLMNYYQYLILDTSGMRIPGASLSWDSTLHKGDTIAVLQSPANPYLNKAEGMTTGAFPPEYLWMNVVSIVNGIWMLRIWLKRRKQMNILRRGRYIPLALREIIKEKPAQCRVSWEEEGKRAERLCSSLEVPPFLNRGVVFKDKNSALVFLDHYPYIELPDHEQMLTLRRGQWVWGILPLLAISAFFYAVVAIIP